MSHLNMKSLLTAALMLGGSVLSGAWAQLSTNPDKFLGNITTRYNVDTDGFKYYQFWNQITPENESKWGSVEGNRGNFSWGGADNCFNYAKNHKFPFKFHAIIWGAQHPGWFNADLSIEERRKAIINWMDKMKAHYPKLDLIDVANECVAGHQKDTYLFEEALGGGGETGWDWLIYAFKEAHKRWPEAILIYNDFNTFQWNTDQYIDLCKALRDGGAPIDAYGCQSHDLTDCSKSTFTASCTKIQNALKMPMYISEYDIGTSDDALQLQRYKEQIPYMWEADYCAGITLWGWIYGATWTTDGNSGIVKNGKDRPAMTWLKEYMASEKAQTAKSPFPGMKKPISLYIVPEKYKPSLNEETTLTIDATLHNGNTIERVEFYVGSKLTETLTEAPYEVKYTGTTKGKKSFKAIVYDSEGNKYERMGGVQVVGPRSPYKGDGITLPGTIEAENFDKGDDGIAFHDSDSQNQGTTAYRTDGAGVDIVTGNGGYAIGYTAQGEWLEYTVNVTKEGVYDYEAIVSSGAENSSFTISMNQDGKLTQLASIDVPCLTSGNWDKYSTMRGRCTARLPEGKYAIRFTITGSNCNIDKVKFKHVEIKREPYNGVIQLPGVIEAENFDKGGEGIAFHDSDAKDEGACGYRIDNEGVDIMESDGRYVLGYTAKDEWAEYTVNFTEEGYYSYSVTVSNGSSSTGGFRLSQVNEDGTLTSLFNRSVPTTGDWDKYRTITYNITKPIEAGQKVLRLTFTTANCNIDKIEFKFRCPTAIDGVEQQESHYRVFTIAGVYVGTVSGDDLPQQLYRLTGSRQLYILVDEATGRSVKLMSQE